jgi:hypothetical protein
VPTQKQTAASRRNVKKAQSAARSKQTLKHLPRGNAHGSLHMLTAGRGLRERLGDRELY